MGIETDSPTERLHIEGNIYCAGQYMGSDRRYKKSIRPLEAPLNAVQSLRGVSYEFRHDEFPHKDFGREGRSIGLIAQEVEAVLPELVKTDDAGFKAVNYAGMVPVLVAAIQEQQALIEQQQQTIAAIAAALTELRDQRPPAHR